MKFACDKCKTRYSIGEERVRGKILKIRCKNCANVITVREGMAGDDIGAAPSAAHGDHRSRPTTAGPLTSSAGSGAGAAAGPRSPQAPAPPQEEWYVSLDGVQAGPMLLAEARRWVASKPHDADLHCWNEGFEDWLPVAQVSQLRDARPRFASSPAPPPLPEKPLFASTLASIQNESSGRTRTSGQSASPSSLAPAPTPMAAKPTNLGARPASPSSAQPSRGTAAPAAPGAGTSSPPRNAFDLGGLTGALPALPAATEPAPITVKSVLEDDDDMSIGEVSRVVKLADLVPKTRPKASTGTTGTQPRIGMSTGSAARISSPRVLPSDLGMNVNPAYVSAITAPSPDESFVARSFAERHRRGMLALIAVSAALVLGLIVAVGFVVSNNSGEIGGGLGGMKQIDTSRPEDIVRRQVALATPGSASTTPHHPKPRPTGKQHSNAFTQAAEDPKGNSLSASEIEDMAAKQGEGTKRCYMRAQKGAMGFEIGDIKKISVTLTVGKDGVVSGVQLSSHGTTSFGQCLIARIKGWRFRESPSGGTYRISLAFSS